MKSFHRLRKITVQNEDQEKPLLRERYPSGGKSEVVEVDLSHLYPVSSRPSLQDYTKQLFSFRYFLISHARSQSFSTGRGTLLGRVWMILDPLFQVLMYALVFGLILHVSRGIDNFIGFLAIGVTYFRFLSAGLTNGVGVIQRNRSLITSFNFPRVAIPLSTSLRSFFDNSIPGLVAIIVALAFQYQDPIHWTLLLVPFFYCLIHIFAAGLTMIIARIASLIPDTRSLVRVFTQGLFFLSGVFFPLSRFAEGSTLQMIMKLNPFFQYLEVTRNATLYGSAPSLAQWLYIIAWSFLTFLVGFVFFWRKEARYAVVK
ncbi:MULTISPECIES: ABC transporter permease [unclassified Corynebacterium]|uniref:ABC transporter permease n=1 Tax=unclassified Corynebacterium TaxID=2624378 RepID=UPI00114CE217|nr:MULTISPECIES: ABC transporter permease [unclassified Corynebacterium]